ncbi:bifunctional 5,10-methylene-tetrahydrofolate dehydrogenase/5,10-methylene-tetrahydrofolate cyclohydrolase [Candidatus Micrarchaeota archaeon]|nr:bifunctional 5,10-methylene-tetrahydrofolate dehydrogenase/5,10-methylene-tetrahydrofolate cyclohydrolase [Candidatus Micrarchaeota archaeon]
MYKILFGKEPAAGILYNSKNIVDSMKRKPSLAIVLVGNDPASEIYVKKKMENAGAVGIRARLEKLPDDISEARLLALVKKLNSDPTVDGFIVQSPLPKHINYSRVVEAIEPKKDVDGWTSTNMGKMFLGIGETFMPATPMGIIKLLDYHGVQIAGKDVTVIGRGNVVGKPLAFMLLERHATVTICHSKTRNLAEHTKNADIIIAAAGVPGLVKADMVKEGAYIIDVGTTRLGEKTVGDVDFERVIQKANCSPVPGGVGPMTVAMLISNVIEAAIRARGKHG